MRSNATGDEQRPIHHAAWLAFLVWAFAATAGLAQDEGARLSPAELLVQREQTRQAVHDAFEIHRERVDNGGVKIDNLNEGVDRLVAIGEPAVPFLVEELRRNSPFNYNFCAIALGRIGGERAEEALLESFERWSAELGDPGIEGTAWAAYGLFQAGRVDMLDRLVGRLHDVSLYSIHNDTSLLAVGALFTAPQSVPILHRQLQDYVASEDEFAWRNRANILKALALVGHPSSRDVILARLSDKEQSVRRTALYSLVHYDEPRVHEAVLQRLQEEELFHVRYAAAWLLEQFGHPEFLPHVTAALEIEPQPIVRGVLYRLVARLGGKSSLRTLSGYLGNPVPEDRAALVEAFRILQTPAALPALRAALLDDSPKVMIQASRGLVELGPALAAEPLLGALRTPNNVRTTVAVDALTQLDLPSAGPAIADRLLEGELSRVIRDPRVRETVFRMGDALLQLGQYDVLPRLRELAPRQQDGQLQAYLRTLIARLETLRQTGDDEEAWIAALDAEDEELRRIAIRRVAHQGNAQAGQALVRRFGRAPQQEGVEILRALGELDHPASRELVLRVISSPSFDPFARGQLRRMAAWSARRLGGQDMTAALETTARRRNGRDIAVLIYLALLQGAEVLPLYDELRLPRMRYLKWTRGLETATLDRIARDLRAGRSFEIFDVPPERLEVNPSLWPATR